MSVYATKKSRLAAYLGWKATEKSPRAPVVDTNLEMLRNALGRSPLPSHTTIRPVRSVRNSRESPALTIDVIGPRPDPTIRSPASGPGPAGDPTGAWTAAGSGAAWRAPSPIASRTARRMTVLCLQDLLLLIRLVGGLRYGRA